MQGGFNWLGFFYFSKNIKPEKLASFFPKKNSSQKSWLAFLKKIKPKKVASFFEKKKLSQRSWLAFSKKKLSQKSWLAFSKKNKINPKKFANFP